MIVNSEHKWMFIHIPKTAGTSLRRALVDGQPVKPKHEYLRNVQYAGWFTFAFVRNPWERLLSLHAYASVKRNAIKQKDFKRWLVDEDWWEGEEVLFKQQETRLPYQRRPMTDTIADNAGEVAVDFVGRFENLQEDIELLRQQHQINIAPLPHINLTPHLDYREVYDDEMRQFVEYHHKIDLINFGYVF